jgi:hypothetical protein
MIHALIQRARRRLLYNEMLSAAAIGTSLAMGSAILVLLLGTQLLDWRVLAAIAGLAFGVIIYRVFSRLPVPYHVAILIDSRANLCDSLSTAQYFQNRPQPFQGSASVLEAQRAHAERLIRGIDLEHTVPFTMPRALYLMGALGLIASSLFALRYGMVHHLDLKAPLTTVLMDTWGFNSPADRTADAKKKNAAAKKADLLGKLGISLPEADQKRAGELDAAPDSALDSTGVPDANNDKAESSKAAPGKSDGAEKMGGHQNNADSDGAESAAAAGKSSSDNSGGSQEGPPQGEQSAGKQSSDGDNSSLLSKLRDAMSNIFSKSKPQSASAGGQKPANGQSKQAQPNGSEKGAPGQGQQAGAQESADAQEGQQTGDSQDAQNANGKGSGKSADQQAAAQPGSGIGKQDGSKDLKNAEQLAAMGKLSEIIGKRSANVSGEMMVEVQSGPQQLRTAYSQHNAKHGESAGEISRDEVPVALQAYVQQYFEQVRKQEPKGAAPAKAKKPAAVPPTSVPPPPSAPL